MIEIKFENDEKSFNMDCNHIFNPEDITNQCKTEEEFTNGVSDYSYISCCSNSGPNSIVTYYKKHFENLKKNFFGKIILRVMCLCCKEKKYQLWKIKTFENCVKKKLKEFNIHWNYE